MRKPRWFKKSLSFFLAFLMLLSSVTVGFTAFADPATWEFQTTYIYDKDNGGFPNNYGGSFSGEKLRNVALAMMSDVVRSLPTDDSGAAASEYIQQYGDGVVHMYDTDQNDFLDLANAVYELGLDKGFIQQSGGGVNDTLHQLMDNITGGTPGTLKGIMGGDYIDAYYYIMTRYFTGCGTATNAASDKARDLWIIRTVAGVLEDYPNVQQVPDELGMQWIYYYTHTKSSGFLGSNARYHTNNIASARQDPFWDKADTGKAENSSNYKRFTVNISTYANALKTFDNTVSADILSILKEGFNASSKEDKVTAYAKLSQAQINTIISSGKNAVTAIQNATAQNPDRTGSQIQQKPSETRSILQQVYDFYYPEYALNDLDDYVDAYLTYYANAYVEAVNDLDAMIKSKGVNDFTVEDIRLMKSYVDTAVNIYATYPDTIKNSTAVVNAKALYDTDYTKYVEINNITALREYRKVIDKIEYVEPDSYSIYDDCKDPFSIYETLCEAEELYKMVIPALSGNATTDATTINGFTYISAADRTDSIKSKQTYDKVLDKYINYILIAFNERAELLKEYYTGTSAPITVKKINYFDIAAMNEKISRVEEVYDNMPDSVKSNVNVIFNMDEVIPKLRAAIDEKIENPGWDRYNIPYPYDTEKSTVESVIKRLSRFVTDEEMNEAVLGMKLDGKMLEDLIIGEDGKTANTIINTVLFILAKAVQGALEDAVKSYPLQGYNVTSYVDLYPYPTDFVNRSLIKNRAASLACARELEAYGYNHDASYWDVIKQDWLDGKIKLDWQVRNIDDFIQSLAGVLTCAMKIVRALLLNENGEAKVLSIVTVRITYECHGYAEAILPLLEMLGCKDMVFTYPGLTNNNNTYNGLPTASDFESKNGDSYKYDFDQILAIIIKPLFLRIQQIIDGNTVGEILDLLPNIAYIIHYGKLAKGLRVFQKGLEQIGVKLEAHDGTHDPSDGCMIKLLRKDGMTPLLKGIYQMDSKWVNDLIKDFTADLGWVIPEIDFATIASLGTGGDVEIPSNRASGVRRYINGDSADILVYLIYLISDIVELNFDKIKGLIPELNILNNNALSAAITDLIDTALENCKEERKFGKAIFQALNSTDVETLDWNVIAKDWPAVKKTIINYGNDMANGQTGYTKAEVDTALASFNGLADALVGMLLANENASSLSQFITDSFFSGETANGLFQLLYKLLDSDAAMMILTMADIVTKDANGEISTSKKLNLKPATIAQAFKAYPSIAAAFQKSADLSKVTIDGTEYDIVDGKVTVGTGDNAVVYEIKGAYTKYYEVPNVPTVDEDGKPVYEEDGTTQKTHTEKVVVYDPFEDIHGGELINPENPKGGRYPDTWNITAITDTSMKQTAFNNAISTILLPFADVIELLLCGNGQTLIAAGVAEIAGTDGYSNIIKPLLDGLGVETLDVLDFKSTTSGTPVNKIIRMVTSLMNKLSNDPFATILNALPSLAYLIENGGLQLIIENIISPLNGIIDAVETLGDMTDGFFEWLTWNILEPLTGQRIKSWSSLHSIIGDVVNGFLSTLDITINEEKYHIAIAPIDWSQLAGCAAESKTAKGNVDTKGIQIQNVDQSDVLVVLLRYIWKVVKANETNFIVPLLKNLLDEETVDSILENVPIFTYSEDKFVAVIVKILSGLDSSDYKGAVAPFADGVTVAEIVNMVKTGSNIVYPFDPSSNTTPQEKYTPDHVKNFITVLSNIATSLLENYADLDLSDLAKNGIYTSSLVAGIAKVIYPLFDSAGSVLEFIGLENYDVDKLEALLRAKGFGKVADVLLVDLDAAEDRYPGNNNDEKSIHPNWAYVPKIGADGNEVTTTKKDADGNEVKETVYEWANRFWAKDDKGAYLMEDGKHVMSYWTKDKEGKWAYDSNNKHIIRDKKLADINWDYINENKLFEIYTEGNSNAQTRARLSLALATVLTPITPLVAFLLNTAEFNIGDSIPLVGASGYENAVYPLLKLLGCDASTLTLPSVYAGYDSTDSEILTAIIDPLLVKLDEILNGKEAVGPVRAVLNIIPDLANFIDNGGIQKFLYTLLYPVSNFVDGVLTVLLEKDTLIYDVAINIVFYSGIIGNKDENKNVLVDILQTIFGNKNEDDTLTFATLHENIFTLVEDIIGLLGADIDVTTNKDGDVLTITLKKLEINGKTLNLPLSIPYPDLKWVAGIGAGKRFSTAQQLSAEATKKRTDSFLAIMQYIWKIVQLNKDTLTKTGGILNALLGDAYATAIPFVNSVFDVNIKNVTDKNYASKKDEIVASANEVVAALVQFTENTDSSSHDVSDKWATFFEYAGYTEPEKHAINYPVIPQKVAGDAYSEDNKYTETDVENTITALTVVVQESLSKILNTSIEGLAADALYTNDIVTTIAKLICSLADNKSIASILDMFGVDLTAETLCTNLEAYGYVDLARAIRTGVKDDDGKLTKELSKLQWDNVYRYWLTDADGNIQYDNNNDPIIAKSTDEHKVVATDENGKRIVEKPGLTNYWYVESLVANDQNDSKLFIEKVWNNKTKPSKVTEADLDAGYRFTRAVMVALSPFSSLINVLFNAGTGEFFEGAISITGTHGYRNAIKPLLDVLDCTTAVTPDVFQKDANGVGEPGDADYVAGDSDYVIYNVLSPIITKLGELLNDPINEVLDIATNLAAFVDNRGLQNAIEEFLYPITQMFGPIINLATRGVKDINGTELQGTTLFDIVFSFIDLGDGVGWNNLHKSVPAIIENFLSVRVLKEKVNDRYVKVHERDKEQVEDAQDKEPEKEYYYVSSQPKLKEDAENDTDYELDEDGNVIYEDVEVIVEDVDKETTFIIGIDINNRTYKLDVTSDAAGLDTLLSDLAYCMINAKALGTATLAEGDADTNTDPSDVKRRSDAFVDIYRAIRKVVNANDEDFISPLIEDVLPTSIYNAVGEYVDNVLHPTTYNDDNILVTLIRVADELGEDLAFKVDEDAYGTYNSATKQWTVSTDDDTWYNLLRITADKATAGAFTDATKKEDVNRALETLWNTVNLVFTKIVFKDKVNIDNLQDFAVENFMNNALLSTLAKAIFSLADNETVSRAFTILQVTMTKKYICDTLEYYGYVELANAVRDFDGKLSDIPWFTTTKDAEGNEIKVPSKDFGEKWYIDDADGFENIVFKAWVDSGNALDDYTLDVSYRFSRALMVVLAPFSKLIEVLTTENIVQFGDADKNISIQGSYGYTSAIKPFLDALACDTISRDQYRADAERDSNYAIYNILNPLIARVNVIMQMPVRGTLGTLARLANFINAGGIQKAIENLLRPITVLINPIVDLITDDFVGEQTGNLYEVILGIVDTALLDSDGNGTGPLAENNITWSNIHQDITKLINAVFPNLYTVTAKDPLTNENKIYKATRTYNQERKRYEYIYKILKVENGAAVKDENGNDVYEEITTTRVTTTRNGVLINGVLYPITIPENINGFLAKLAGCSGETVVDFGDTGSLLPKEYVDNKAAYNNDFLKFKKENVYAKVAVELLRFVWDAVQANVDQFIDPLLTNLLDPALDLSNDGIDKAYTDFIREYIINDESGIIDQLLGRAKVTLNYDNGEFVDLIVGLVNSLDASNHHATDWNKVIEAAYVENSVTYPTDPYDSSKTYTSNEVKNLVNVLSNIAMSAIDAFLDLSTVGLADDNIYSSQLVVTVAKSVYPLFDSAAVQTVLDVLGVNDVTLDTLADELTKQGYDRTAALVLADITDSDLEIDGHKVNWTTTEKKNADGKYLDENNKVVDSKDKADKIDVNRFWSTDKDGKFEYVDGTASFELLNKEHIMSYWIASEAEDGTVTYEKYTAEDEKADSNHKAGDYKVRDKQFADINWDIAADNAFFKITGDGKDLGMTNAVAYRQTLVKALAAVLYPLLDVVDFLFNSGALEIYGVAHLRGADGYENAIYPLLQVLGCDSERNGLKTPEDYKKEAKEDRINLLTNILNPLFSRLNNILLGSEGNVGSFGFGKVILNTLPNLAIFIDNGGIQKLVGELIYPIGNIVDTLIGVLSKDKTSLFNVAFDAFVTPDALVLLHDADSFEGTGLTNRIIEKLVVAVFNPTAKTDASGNIDNNVLQWANAHKNIYQIAACFLKEDKNSTEPKVYLAVNDDGQLEIHNIVLSRTTKDDNGNEVTTKYNLPAVKIPSLNNELLGKLAKLGAPIPWTEDGYNKNDGNGPKATQRRTDALVTVWTFIWSIVENNFDKDATDTKDLFLNQLLDGFLKDLMGEDLFNRASPYIKTLLSRSSSRVLAAFILATQDLATTDTDYSQDWDAYFESIRDDLERPVYPIKNAKEDMSEIDDEGNERYEDKDVTTVLHTFSGIAQSVLSAITDKSLSELSVDLIFTDEIIATIAQAIFSLASNEKLKAFLPLLDIDLSLENIIDKLDYYGYHELRDVVKDINNDDTKDLADIEWFVQDKDGNKVPSRYAHMWYVDDARDEFKTKVYDKATNNVVAYDDVDAQYRFTRALFVVLAPFSDLINTLFNAGTSEWFADVDENDNIIAGTGFNVTGAYGYRNAVKPLMQALSIDAMSVADFTDSVTANGNDYVLFNVIYPILSRIDAIIKSPGSELFATVASLGAFIGDKNGAFEGKGNLQTAIEFLLSPILAIIDPIIDLADDRAELTVFKLVFDILGITHKGATKDKDIAVTWDNVHEHLFDVVAYFLKYNKDKPDNLYAETLESVMFIKNITINGNKYTLELPEYDLSKLRNCTVAEETEKRSADAFVTVFRYIERILKTNSVDENSKQSPLELDKDTFITKLIFDLTGGDEKDTFKTIEPYLRNVFGSKDDTLLVTVIRMFINIGESALTERFPTIEKVTEYWNEKLKLTSDTADVDYKDLAVSEVTTAINTVRDSVTNAIDAYGNGFKLENLTTDYIYKNSIPALLANVIFPLGDNNLIEALLKIIGADLSRDFIIKELEKNGYVELAELIKDADKRIEEDETGKTTLANAIEWKVQATDEDGNLLWNDAAKTDPKLVANPDIVKLWYVEDEQGFLDNVWATGGNSNRDPNTIDASYRFKRAIVTVLAPFRELLGVFLANQSILIFDDPHVDEDGNQLPGHSDVVLMGERGYANAIKPLLEALGFDAVEAQTYLNNVAIDRDYILYGIIDPILARVDEILDRPVREVLDTLNSLALYLANGGLQESIKNLLYPITKILSPVVRLILGEVVSDNQIDMRTMSGLYDLIIGFVAEFFDIEALQLTDDQRAEGFSIWENLHKWDYLKELLQRVLKLAKIEKITINGVAYPITIPANGPFDKLASCRNVDAATQKAVDDAQAALDALMATGTATDAEIDAAKAALATAQEASVEEVRANTLLALIQYVWYVVEENEPEFITPLLKNLLGDNYDKFSKYINRVLGKDGAKPEDVSTAVVRLLNAIDSSDHGADGSVVDEWNELLGNRVATEVKYPEDGSYTANTVSNAVQTLSNIITGVLENFLDTSVTELTTEKIYTNEIVNALAGALYPAVAGMESILKIAGVDVSKENVAQIIGDTYGYTDISAIIMSAKPAEKQTWANAVAWGLLDWKVDNNSDNFAHAIAAVLAPFNSLIDALLCAGEVNVASVIPITGSNGYKNALQPFLNELGFKTDGIIDENDPTLEGIIKVVLHKIDEIVTDENLVGKVIDILPGLANFVANGGIQKFVEELIYPITHLIDPIFRLVADDEDQTIFDFAINLLADLDVIDLTDYGWSNIHTQIFTIAEKLIGDGITINDKTYPLTIPENIKGLKGNIFNALAGCSILSNGNANANSVPDTLVTLLRYVWTVVTENSNGLIKPLVENLLGADTYSNIKKYIVNLLDDTTTDEFVEAVIEVLNSLDKIDCNGVDWSDIYKDYVGGAVEYPIKGIKNIEAEVTAKDVADIISTLSGAVEAVIPMILKDYASLNDFVSEKLYTDSIVNALAKILLPLCENDTVVNILSIIGVDYSVDTVFVSIDTKLGSETNLIEKAENAKSLKDIDWSTVTWGVKDSASFAKALAVLLDPFTPVVDFILNGKNLPIANDAVEIAGDNGYKNAVKQLLTVLGCDLDALNAIDEYASLEDVINVVLSRVEVILDAPVDEVLGMVAGIANFVNNSGLQIMIEELVHPITNIINPIVRLASDRVDGKLTDASIFDIAFDVLKDKLDLDKDANWMNIQNYIFDIAVGFIKVNYVVVNGKNIAVTKVTDEADANYGKFSYVDGKETKYVDKAEQMNGIAINGIAYKLTIPSTVNKVALFEALANCGTLNATKDAIVGNGADTLVTVLRYVWSIVEANEKAFITPLLKELLKADEKDGIYGKVAKYLTNLFDSSADQVIAALVETLNRFEKDGHIADWTKVLEKKPVEVKYPNGLKAFDVTDAIYRLTNIFNAVMPKVLESTGYKSLRELVNGKLYKDNSLIVTIADAIRGLGLNEDGSESDLNKTLKSVVGIDFTAVPTKIGAVKDSASFATELAKVLAPFNGIVDALLNGKAMVIAEGVLGDKAITIEGENAYVNAVKPLLQVLGCSTNGITDGSATLEAILKTVLGRVDELLDSKNIINDILTMVPDIANFINNGGIQLFIDELIYPVMRIVAPIADLLGVDSVFDIVLSILGVDVDWDNIQNNLFDIVASVLKPNDKKNNVYAELTKKGNLVIHNIAINGKNYNIEIPAFDLAKLAGATDENGKAAEAVLITVLRYVWNVVETNKNSFIIPMLKSVLGKNYNTFGEYIEKALSNKADDVIKALIGLFSGLDASDHKADWSFLIKNYKATNVKYPNGVTAKDLEQVVEILSIAVDNALGIFLGKSLDDLVPDMIYTDSLIKTLADAIGSLKNNKDLKDIFKLLGVDFSKVNYNQKWKVTDKRSFANALATILSPFNNLLAVLLNAGEFNIEGMIELTGANGYENAIKPLLDTLGCKTVSASKYKSDALRNSNNILLNILNPLLDRVDVILANPIEEVLNLLPAIANFINKGGVQKFVEELIYPITNLVNPVVKLVTNDNVFDFALKLLNKLGVLDTKLTWKNLQNQIIPLANTFLTNIKINGKSYKITVPNINWATLGGCGKVSGNAIVGKNGDVLLTLLRYVFKALDANKNMLFNLVGGKNSTIGQIVNNVLKQGADGMAKIVVRILLKLDTFDNVQWTFKNIKEITVKYTEHLGEEIYLESIGRLDETIAGLLNDLAHISLDSVLSDLVYTNSIINTVAKLIYTNIEKVDIGIDLNTVLKVVDLDVSTKGVASILKDYSAASRAIGSRAKWSDVNFDSINWGFKDGNRDGFVNALSAILRPVQPILRVVLSGEDLVVLGSIKIKGGNGYNTAIIPLLEALDVNPATLVSPQQYNKEASTDKVLTNILNPLLDKVEELTHGPIDALTKILPNLAYFVYNGGVQAIAENLIAPITNILHEIDPIYSLNLDLSMLGDVDLAGLVNGILAGIKIQGQPLGIVLPNIDLSILSGLGKLVTYRSARTYFGKQMDCKKINADQAAVFITVLRYIVKTLQQNLDNIKKLLENLGLSGDLANTIATVLKMLTDMDVDGVIEAIMNLLFGYDIGGEGASNSGSDKNGLAFGSFTWLYSAYWVIFAITILIFAYFIFLLFKKDEDVFEEDPENPEGPNPPENSDEEQKTYKDNYEQGVKI